MPRTYLNLTYLLESIIALLIPSLSATKLTSSRRFPMQNLGEACMKAMSIRRWLSVICLFNSDSTYSSLFSFYSNFYFRNRISYFDSSSWASSDLTLLDKFRFCRPKTVTSSSFVSSFGKIDVRLNYDISIFIFFLVFLALVAGKGKAATLTSSTSAFIASFICSKDLFSYILIFIQHFFNLITIYNFS